MNKLDQTACPCGSGNTYEECCKPYHQGKEPENALKLMRARYVAYVYNLPEFIIKTTHPVSPQYRPNRFSWTRNLAGFSRSSQFERLEIHDFTEQDPLAVVTFTAHLTQDGKDATFSEMSYFEKTKDRWLYKWGRLVEGHAPNLNTTRQLKLLPIAYYGDPILRKKADVVTEITDDTKRIIEDMIETMDACSGVGIAAPQVHHSIRIFVIRRPIEVKDTYELGEVKVFINPELSDPSEESWKTVEGCLSIPSIHGEVKRAREITVEYTDLQGKRITERVSNWQARVIQHEFDHLNGVLFIDHLSETERKQINPYLDHLQKRIHDGTEL